MAHELGPYPTEKTISDVYWRTLIFNSTVDFERATPDYHELRGLADFIQFSPALSQRGANILRVVQMAPLTC
jgi:hypothetical protein